MVGRQLSSQLCPALLYSIPHIVNFWYFAKLWWAHHGWYYNLAKTTNRMDVMYVRLLEKILKRALIIFLKSGVLYRRWGVFKKLQCHFQGPRTEWNQRQMGAQSCACSFIWTWESWSCLTPELRLDQPSEAKGWSQCRAAWRCSSRNG